MPHMDLKRAQEVMKQKGIDALVASTYQNFYYASGYKARMARRPVMAVVPAASGLAPAMIVGSYVERQAREKSQLIKDVRSYPMWLSMVNVDDVIAGKAQRPFGLPKQFSHEDVFGMLSDIFREKGLHDGTIGIEQNLFTDPAYPVLPRQSPEARFVEAESVFWELRKIKTDDEIKVMRLAEELAEKGIQGIIEGGVLGETVSDLRRKFKMAVLQATVGLGPLDLYFDYEIINPGPEFNGGEIPELRVAKGDVIFVDVSLQVFGYNSDIGRTFVAGKPNELQKKMYAAVRAGLDEGISRLKPGVKMKEIHRVIQDAVRRNGLDWYSRGHTGHTIGIGIGPGCEEQPPLISADEETELEPNMVICIEGGVYVIGLGVFHVEDEILITPEGHEVLTKLPRDMVEL